MTGSQSMPGAAITLADLARRLGATLEGDARVTIDRVGTLESAGPGAVTFFSNPKLRPLLAQARAGAVILRAADAPATTLPKLLHDNPYAAYARAAQILHPVAPAAAGIDPSAHVHPRATVDATAHVGPCAVIEEGASIGARTVVGPHVVIGSDCVVGEDVRLHARATLYPRCVVGARTIVHSGAVLGADGFGMAEDQGQWIKIPQVGRVVIGDDCEIGANTTIDRGTIDDTVIEDDVKLDNQIQIGHNCRIGAHTAIAGCTGIAGSTVVGRHVRIGGAVNIGGHLHIPDRSVLAGGTTVVAKLRAPGFYNGSFPVMTHDEWRHVAVEIRRLRALKARVAALERALRIETPDEGDAT